MSKVKLKTLTPVHVGSGVMLQHNTDFVTVKAGDGIVLRIIEDKKILELIGKQHVNDWVLSIERKDNTKDFVKLHAPNAKVADYSRRKLTCEVTNIKKDDTLKECIHNGMGYAYIPGSSIKGAIRTAIVATLAKSLVGLEGKISSGFKPNATKVEKELFGNQVNEDLFRFLQVGDAYFENDVEMATRMVNLNIREKRDIWDASKPQLVEAIDENNTSIFQLKVLDEYHEWVKSKSNDKFSLKDLPTEMDSISNLFSTINQHTKGLLEEEIEFWSDYNEDVEVNDYIELMKEVLEATNTCKAGESCVLRIGHGSGWRFITGAWSEKLSNFTSDVVAASRPRNNNYENYPFPKTRRLDEFGDIFGFVKLEIID